MDAVLVRNETVLATRLSEKIEAYYRCGHELYCASGHDVLLHPDKVDIILENIARPDIVGSLQLDNLGRELLRLEIRLADIVAALDRINAEISGPSPYVKALKECALRAARARCGDILTTVGGRTAYRRMSLEEMSRKNLPFPL